MKKLSWLAVVVLFIAVSTVLTGCPRNSYNNPSSPYGNANTSTATPTATGPTSTPTSTRTSTGTATSTNSPTGTFTPTITFTSTNSPTVTMTFTITNTATGTSTATITDTPTMTDTPTITPTPTDTFTPTLTSTHTHTATITSTATNTDTPTVTPTPKTITVAIINGSLGGYSGYYYSASGFSNNTSTGVLSLTARVGDTIVLPSGSPHTLYFDAGSATCIFSGATAATQSYTFTSQGTYYFHCGVHAQNCSSQHGCGSTNCTAMAGTVVVTP